MDDLLNQIEAASNASLYYLALAGALMVPDVCAAMEAEGGLATRARYAAWFDRYVAFKYAIGPLGLPSLAGADCYQFRCAFLHQGRLQDLRKGIRILFLEPGRSGLIMHNNVPNRALNIDVRIFCSDIVAGVGDHEK